MSTLMVGIIGIVCIVLIIFTFSTVLTINRNQERAKNLLDTWMFLQQKTQSLIAMGYVFTADSNKPVIIDPDKKLKFDGIEQAWNHYITNNQVK